MSGTAEAVVRMANQIARNFSVMDDDDAARATAEHIDLFWDPRMKAAGFAAVGDHGGKKAGLGPVAARALMLLAQEEKSAP